MASTFVDDEGDGAEGLEQSSETSGLCEDLVTSDEDALAENRQSRPPPPAP